MIQKKKIFQFITIIPPIIIMIAIFCFSAQPANESSQLSSGAAGKLLTIAEHITGITFTEERRIELCEQLQFPIRKGAHMSEYAVLGISILIPLCLWKENWSSKKLIIVSILLTMGYAATDECHQLFVPGRAGRMGDVLIDGTGAAIGITVIFFFISRVLKNKRAGK